MQRPIVALDLGSTKVACAVGLPHEQTPGFELLGSSVVPYPLLSESWLSDPLMVGRTIEQALEATAVTGEFHRALVVMSHPLLANEQLRATIHIADEPIAVRQQDLDRLTARALDQALSVDREPLVVERLQCSGNGFEAVRDPLGRPATRLSGFFHIVTMPMAARRAIGQAVESAGLEVMQLSFSLSAIAAALAGECSQQQRFLLVDVGGLNTDVGLFVDGQLWSAKTVPWGGLSFALEIARTLSTTIEQAMTMSLQGLTSRKPEVRQLLERELVPLKKAMEQTLKGEPLPDLVLVTGRGALIDGLVEWLEQTTTVKAALARTPCAQGIGDMARQIALTPVAGLLELATRTPSRVPLTQPARFVDRLVHRTRLVLTEYF
jgi:cell division protein FtsA